MIGASAGGVETLRRVVADLPADLPATVCVVLHIAPSSPSALASILERAGRLPCQTAIDGMPLRPGEILVAPPDRHLVIEDGHVRLTVGPRENGHRPAVDTLFRSAAARDGRVLGVILSGMRDDGSAGLAVIKSRGGAAVIQDPDEALYPGMPRSAVASVDADAIVPSQRLAETITAIVNGDGPPPPAVPVSAEFDPTAQTGARPPFDDPLTTICPECGGVLRERTGSGVRQWECRVGHRYSPGSLLQAQGEGVEAALWTAVRALEDRRIVLERIADRFEAGDHPASATSLRRRAIAMAAQENVVRQALVQVAAESLSEVGEEAEGREADPLERSSGARGEVAPP